MAISFAVSKDDDAIIQKIISRIFKDEKTRHRLDLEMDLKAAHGNGHPLRLQELLDADDFNFWHDISGITAYLNRDDATHKFEPYRKHFHPRFSQPTQGV